MMARLDAPFHQEGWWWLPEAPSDKFPGVLSYNGGDLKLSARGNLDAAGLISARAQVTTPLLYGNLGGGYPVSACNAIPGPIEFGATSRDGALAASQTFTCEAAVMGAHVASADFEVRVGSASFENLEVWTQAEAFGVNTPASGSRAVEITLARPAEWEYDLPSIDATARFFAKVYTPAADAPGWQRTEAAIERWIEIEPRNPQPYRWFSEQFWLVRLLLSVVMGTPTWARAVEGEVLSLDDSYRDASLLLLDKRPREPVRLHARHLPFPLPRVVQDSPDFLEHWFARMSKAKTSVELFIGALQNPDSYPHQRFSSMVHALEAFHRQMKGGRYLSDAEYQPIEQRLLAALPEELDRSHRDALKNKIKYGYQYSLRKRLNELRTDLTPALQQVVSPDLKRFLERVVVTRNYFTHWELDPDKQPPFPASELMPAATRLSRLLTFHLMLEMGVTSASIEERFGHLAKGN